MLKQITKGILIHDSEFLESKTIIVQGQNGVLLIDPGITEKELDNLADDLEELNQPVIAGFSTHPHWDHILWHAKFGDIPRYATARCAADIQDLLSHADWKAQVAAVLPPDISEQIPMDLLGLITGLPTGTTHIPWDGPKVRIIEHQAHAAGHAALLIEESDLLIAGDMLSDILIPFLDLEATDPTRDYTAALELIESVVDDTTILITGHGSIAKNAQVRARIELDRAYILALRDGSGSDDTRLITGPNREWLPGVHAWQAQQILEKRTQ